jgi:hypothetical protein
MRKGSYLFPSKNPVFEARILAITNDAITADFAEACRTVLWGKAERSYGHKQKQLLH